jgi:hypothetical protein
MVFTALDSELVGAIVCGAGLMYSRTSGYW